MTEEAKMLNVAAAERTLLRQSLQDCVISLELFKHRDECSGGARRAIWGPGEPAAQALKQAKQLLRPHSELRLVKRKEAVTCGH